MILVEPDKTLTWFSSYHALLADLNIYSLIGNIKMIRLSISCNTPESSNYTFDK